MLWGAAEIALADEATGAPAAQLSADLATAARWARAYIAQGHPADGDTFNLYDNGAVAEAELLQAMQQARRGDPGHRAGRAARRPGRPAAHRRGLGQGRPVRARHPARRRRTPRRTRSACSSPTRCTRSTAARAGSQSFAQQQLNFALGANAWGSSFVVGAGTVFPHCMQSEIANLAGSLTGTGDIQLGATTDGPSSPGNFVGLGTVTGMRACSAGNYAPFDTATARLRGQRGLLALGRARRRLHRRFPARLRPRRCRPWLMLARVQTRSSPCWPSTAATARRTWPSWPTTARSLPRPAARASTPIMSASTRPC